VTKADAALRVARTLVGHGVLGLEDLPRLRADPESWSRVDRALSRIPGEGQHGVRRSYFWMLCGAEDQIKPDRTVLRWLTHFGVRDPATARQVCPGRGGRTPERPLGIERPPGDSLADRSRHLAGGSATHCLTGTLQVVRLPLLAKVATWADVRGQALGVQPSGVMALSHRGSSVVLQVRRGQALKSCPGRGTLRTTCRSSTTAGLPIEVQFERVTGLNVSIAGLAVDRRTSPLRPLADPPGRQQPVQEMRPTPSQP
jgi:hypothetical protein